MKNQDKKGQNLEKSISKNLWFVPLLHGQNPRFVPNLKKLGH